MTSTTLTLIDVRHVQAYLFNANELKQNLGASAIVEQATHDWIFEFLPARRNAEWNKQEFQVDFEDKSIDGNQLDAEIIFMGGGNAAILFSSDQEARSFSRRYTETLMVRAPGLEAAVAHVDDVDLSRTGAIREAWQRIQQVEMPRQKEGRLVSQPILGLSVTAECAYTGLPAVAEIAKGQGRILVSAESYKKQSSEIVNAAKDRLGGLLNIEGFEYPTDFEELGSERGSSSFLAAVHVDGNGMGKRIQNYTEHDDNREMIRRMRLFSEKVNQIGLNAMKAVRDYLATGIHLADDKKRSYALADRFDEQEIIRLKDNFLPIRPLVFGGDDITFVCEGRLGLSLAVKILEAFSNAQLPDGIKTYACAGVAIVHSHYPFARAYALAEELCQSAKQQARLWDEQSRLSLINWHITSSGLTLDWNEIKEREYQDGKLLLRPLVINKADDVSAPAWQTWETLTDQISGFRQKPWSTQRNKQKDLREVLRKGSDATRKFTGLHGDLPKISTAQPKPDANKTGWIDQQCLYFDALEAMDLFVYPMEVKHD